MRPRTTDYATEDKILALLSQGVSQRMVALMCGTTRSVVQYIVAGQSIEARECDMSEAELDAMIAEQMPTMPSDPRIERQKRFVPHAVQRGRGIQATWRSPHDR